MKSKLSINHLSATGPSNSTPSVQVSSGWRILGALRCRPIGPSQWPYEICTLIILSLQMRKPMLRAVHQPFQFHLYRVVEAGFEI